MNKHDKPLLSDFKAMVIDESCIKITISEQLDITNASLKILGENRNFLAEIRDPSYVTTFCVYPGNPMFIELHTPAGVSVHYVEGSGKDFYEGLNYN